MSKLEHFRILKSDDSGYRLFIILLTILIAVGYAAAHHMESHGHWVSGMNNQVVWGLPHVFAILLILSASGALNIGSMSSVFGQSHYKSWSRFSGLLAIVLLVGGLIVLVLDLGRPERLVVAMTHYNFKSIFAWNIFLYSGFVAVVIVYLWVQFQRSLNHYVEPAGLFAFIWRFVLTSGTGGIFGFIVARELYDSAMMIPVFIVLSLVLGTSVFLLVQRLTYRWSGVALETETAGKLARLLGIFVALELFLVMAFHLTSLYSAEHQGVEWFILSDGGLYTILFWIGQVGFGGLIPLAVIYAGSPELSMRRILVASGCAVVGAFAQLYVLIVGGQAYPQILFPGKTVQSSFYDGVIAGYSPSIYELALGAGGVSLSLLGLFVLLRILPFVPDNRTS